MKVVILIENLKAQKHLKSEHGLSVYIEKDEKKYLLDVGQSGAFIKNADKLGVDVSDIDAVFISHNHYDHIGGLKAFFKKNRKAKVYLSSKAKEKCYAKQKSIVINIGGNEKLYSKYPERFEFLTKNYELNGIHMVMDSVGDKEFFCQDKKLVIKQNGKYVPDDFEHEMFLCIEEKGKVHVLSSCSHRGIVNILKTVKREIKQPIGIVLAGLHMSAKGGKELNCSIEYLDMVADEIKTIKMDKLYTCHCTGIKAYEELKSRTGEKTEYIKTGDILEI